ncbi:MAG: NTP transferase domain-containing protein [Candidatus Thermoplasmatota archaeon]|nr:NTP transferase domain-containing protein [Candidatus Thermoplasmatota archaeon]
MNSIILAGGYATRLWPVTKEKAKPLLPLGGKPILSYILDELEELPEMDKIYITTNERFESSFRNYLKEREEERYELLIEKQEAEEEKYGAIGGIINALESGEKGDYLVIGGDNHYSFEIKEFVNFALKKGGVTNACFEVESIDEAKNYGIVDFDENGKIRDFQEKPEQPKSRMASTAFYYFPENILEIFEEYIEYWDGRISKEKYLDEPGRFLAWTSERYDCYAFPFKGTWADVGTRQGYLRAEKEIRKENIVRGQVKDSEIGENVTILKDTEVKNSEIENSIIFEDCDIESSMIKDSIVGEGTEIEDLDLREGLVKKFQD